MHFKSLYGMVYIPFVNIMGGYEALRTIRALGTKRAGEIPTIAMAANVFEYIRTVSSS